MMDKGLGLREAEHFIEANEHLTDIVKFGFGTSSLTKNFEEKIRSLEENNINHILVELFLKHFMLSR